MCITLPLYRYSIPTWLIRKYLKVHFPLQNQRSSTFFAEILTSKNLLDVLCIIAYGFLNFFLKYFLGGFIERFNSLQYLEQGLAIFVALLYRSRTFLHLLGAQVKVLLSVLPVFLEV
jgi:hypothetical protein